MTDSPFGQIVSFENGSSHPRSVTPNPPANQRKDRT